MKYINSIKEISNEYDYFLIDLNGIVWNFKKDDFKKSNSIDIFDWIPDTLEFLYKNNKTIIFFSNLRQSARDTKSLLVKSGFDEKYLTNIFTSGESLLYHIKNGKWKNFKYKYISPETSFDLLDKNTKFKSDDNIDNVDFVVSRGFEIKDNNKNFYVEELNKALSSGKPIFFINPNKTSKLGLDVFNLEQLDRNDKVIGFGKPYNTIYEQILNIYNIKNKSKIIAIGDRLHTDVCGAQNNGIDCLFVINGKLKDEINSANLNSLLTSIESLSKGLNICTPKYIIENFMI